MAHMLVLHKVMLCKAYTYVMYTFNEVLYHYGIWYVLYMHIIVYIDCPYYITHIIFMYTYTCTSESVCLSPSQWNLHLQPHTQLVNKWHPHMYLKGNTSIILLPVWHLSITCQSVMYHICVYPSIDPPIIYVSISLHPSIYPCRI